MSAIAVGSEGDGKEKEGKDGKDGKEGRGLLWRLASDVVEYLHSHSLDPCNLFVGAIVSDYLSSSLCPVRTSPPRATLYSQSLLPSSFLSDFSLERLLCRWDSIKHDPIAVCKEVLPVVLFFSFSFLSYLSSLSNYSFDNQRHTITTITITITITIAVTTTITIIGEGCVHITE